MARSSWTFCVALVVGLALVRAAEAAPKPAKGAASKGPAHKSVESTKPTSPWARIQWPTHLAAHPARSALDDSVPLTAPDAALLYCSRSGLTPKDCVTGAERPPDGAAELPKYGFWNAYPEDSKEPMAAEYRMLRGLSDSEPNEVRRARRADELGEKLSKLAEERLTVLQAAPSFAISAAIQVGNYDLANGSLGLDDLGELFMQVPVGPDRFDGEKILVILLNRATLEIPSGLSLPREVVEPMLKRLDEAPDRVRRLRVIVNAAPVSSWTGKTGGRRLGMSARSAILLDGDRVLAAFPGNIAPSATAPTRSAPKRVWLPSPSGTGPAVKWASVANSQARAYFDRATALDIIDQLLITLMAQARSADPAVFSKAASQLQFRGIYSRDDEELIERDEFARSELADQAALRAGEINKSPWLTLANGLGVDVYPYDVKTGSFSLNQDRFSGEYGSGPMKVVLTSGRIISPQSAMAIHFQNEKTIPRVIPVDAATAERILDVPGCQRKLTFHPLFTGPIQPHGDRRFTVTLVAGLFACGGEVISAFVMPDAPGVEAGGRAVFAPSAPSAKVASTPGECRWEPDRGQGTETVSCRNASPAYGHGSCRDAEVAGRRAALVTGPARHLWFNGRPGAVFALESDVYIPELGNHERSVSLAVNGRPARSGGVFGPKGERFGTNGIRITYVQRVGAAPVFLWQQPRDMVSWKALQAAPAPVLPVGWHTLRVEGDRSACSFRLLVDGNPVDTWRGACDLARIQEEEAGGPQLVVSAESPPFTDAGLGIAALRLFKGSSADCLPRAP